MRGKAKRADLLMNNRERKLRQEDKEFFPFSRFIARDNLEANLDVSLKKFYEISMKSTTFLQLAARFRSLKQGNSEF